jgi:hypothetical protein
MVTKAQFERSRFDKDMKKAPEGSPADVARDKRQMAAMRKAKGMMPKKGK